MHRIGSDLLLFDDLQLAAMIMVAELEILLAKHASFQNWCDAYGR